MRGLRENLGTRTEIRLLGRFEAAIGGEPIPVPKAKKAQQLLAYLVLREGRPLARQAAAELLWPEITPEKARFNLRQLLAAIRREAPEIGEHLSASSEDLAFDTDRCCVDLFEFRRLVDADPARAVSLYRGPLLELADSEWLQTERSEIDDLQIRALTAVADASPQNERATWLRRAAAIDPYRESTQRKLIVSLSEAGDNAGAELAYRQFQLLLHRELHAAPSAETDRVMREIRGQNQAVQGVSRESIPRFLTSFIGRQKEIADLEDLLAQARLVTILGIGGAGKTRLSVQVMSRVRQRFPQGACFADLSTIMNPDLTPQTVAAALGLRGEDYARRLSEHLMPKTVLLVLDNCEHVAPAAGRLCEALLRACPRLWILTTSRALLGVEGEVAYRLPSLSLPDFSRPIERLDQFEAPRLFAERVRLHRHDFRIDAENAEDVAAICLRMEGLPLGIELAAAQSRSVALPELRRRIEGRFVLQTGAPATASSRRRTMEGVLDWSFDLLKPLEKLLLCRLSAFGGGWTLDAAESICRPDIGPVLPVLSSLIDQSLAAYEPSSNGARYRLLEPVREFAEAKWPELENPETIKGRHAAHFLEFAEKSAAPLEGPNQARQLLVVDAEQENLRRALSFYLGSPVGAEAALRLSLAEWRFWWYSDLSGEGCDLMERAIAHPHASDFPALRAEAQAFLAWLLWQRTLYAKAWDLYEESLQGFLKLGDLYGSALPLLGLGTLATFEGRFEDARRYLEEAADRCPSERHFVAGLIPLTHGLLDLRLERFEEARERLDRSLQILLGAGDRQAARIPLKVSALLAFQRADFSMAKSLWQQSLQGCADIREAAEVSNLLANLAMVAQGEGDADRAAALWGASHRLEDTRVRWYAPFEGEMRFASFQRAQVDLGPELFQLAYGRGAALPFEQVIEYALAP